MEELEPLLGIIFALLVGIIFILLVGRIIGWALGLRDIRIAIEEQTKTLDHLFQLQKYIAKQQGNTLPESTEDP